MSEDQVPASTAVTAGGDVTEVRLADGRRVLLVGTAHISRESVDLVREVIARERPDTVAVELDPRRFEALSNPEQFANLDLREVLRKRQLAALIANLLLVSYQKRLGHQLGVIPGSELLEAVNAAKEHSIPFELADRDVRVTLRRAWHSIGLWRKSQLLSGLLASAFDRTELSEDDLRKLRQRDVISEVMRELGEAMPQLKLVLIDERDAYLAQRIRDIQGQTIVAVVGAGHIEGMVKALESGTPADLDELSVIPAVKGWVNWLGMGIPVTILGSLLWIGVYHGAAAAGHNALYWFLATGIPSAIGTLLAFGHPLTILAAFLAAPFTTLSPLIGAGHVAALVQIWFQPPKVHELQNVGIHMNRISNWWRSRLLRIFLVFVLSSLGAIAGTWIGGIEILSNLK